MAARSPARTSAGPGRDPQADAHLGGHDAGQGGLAQPGRPGEAAGGRPPGPGGGPPPGRSSRCSFSWAWPTNSASRRGRRLTSSAASTGSADPATGRGPAGTELLARAHRPVTRRAGQAPQGQAQQVLDASPSSGRRAQRLADLVGAVAEAGQGGPDLGPGRRPGPDAAPVGPTRDRAGSSRSRSRRDLSSISSRAGRLLADAGDQASGRRRRRSATARRSAAGEWTDSMARATAGPTPWAPMQRLEAAPLVAGGEAVEDDGVLPDVGVDVDEDRRRRARPAGPAAPPGTMHPVADPAHLDQDLAARPVAPSARSSSDAPQRADHRPPAARADRRPSAAAAAARRRGPGQVADGQGQGVGRVGRPGPLGQAEQGSGPCAAPAPWWPTP